MISRRTFTLGSGSILLTSAIPRLGAQKLIRFDSYPFGLGVASGSPTPDGVVLWTRIALDPFAPLGGVSQSTIPVYWEVSNDEAMHDIVQSGTVDATSDWGFSVHVEVNGLKSNRWYFYRFRAGDAESPVGRTHTTPAYDAQNTRLRFAVTSCQHYEHGYFGAYRHIIADSPDLVVFLGDYIYESNTKKGVTVRRHNASPPRNLDEYRARYALYRTDPDLQAAHAHCPWIVTWDDHEVRNNYAGDWAPRGHRDPLFLSRRAAAYRAYYEHMPLPKVSAPRSNALQLYAHYPFGKLLDFHVLDGRQYRSPPACPEVGNRLGPECTERWSEERSYLGQTQERWLEEGLRKSHARWNILVQPTLFTSLDRDPGQAELFSADGWDGYPLARKRLLRSIENNRPSNPIFFGGDLHAFFVADVRQEIASRSKVIASEFVTSSISARKRSSQEFLNKLRRHNPHILYANGTKRGYIRVEVAKKKLNVDLQAMTSVATPNEICHTAASYRVEDGIPGPRFDSSG